MNLSISDWSRLANTIIIMQYNPRRVECEPCLEMLDELHMMSHALHMRLFATYAPLCIYIWCANNNSTLF